MRFITSIVSLLSVCGLAAAGHLHYPHHAHHHHGSSYVVVSKHEEPAVKHEWADHHHEVAHYEQKSEHEGDTHEEYDGHNDHEEDYYAPPKYEFDYAVKDEKTGDSKKHWETRDGDKVKGESNDKANITGISYMYSFMRLFSGGYTIKEADGTTRIVEYTADHKNGYNAVVKTVGHAHEHSHYIH